MSIYWHDLAWFHLPSFWTHKASNVWLDNGIGSGFRVNCHMDDFIQNRSSFSSREVRTSLGLSVESFPHFFATVRWIYINGCINFESFIFNFLSIKCAGNM